MISDVRQPRISRDSQIPLYHQIANDLRERIVSGAWAAGRRLPSEAELTQLYGASRITIRQALANLADEGLVSREPGRGSFVRDPSITAGPRRLTSFTDEMRSRGMHSTSTVLANRIEPADTRTAELLQVDVGTPTVRLERLRYGDGQPVGIQVSHLVAAQVPGFETLDFSDRSLYEELARRAGITIEEAEETYIVSAIDGSDAERLEVAPGTPGLVVERVGWSGGQVVEFTRSLMRGDRYRVQIRLRRTARSHRADAISPVPVDG